MEIPEEFLSISSFSNSISSLGPICGIDYGMKNIGISISNDARSISLPLSVLNNDEFLFINILDLIRNYKIAGFVIGIPLKMKNGFHEISKNIINFSVELKNRFNLPIVFIDERMTSAFARKIINSTVPKNRKIFKIKKDDDIAAALILKTFLEILKTEK